MGLHDTITTAIYSGLWIQHAWSISMSAAAAIKFPLVVALCMYITCTESH